MERKRKRDAVVKFPNLFIYFYLFFFFYWNGPPVNRLNQAIIKSNNVIPHRLFSFKTNKHDTKQDIRLIFRYCLFTFHLMEIMKATDEKKATSS